MSGFVVGFGRPERTKIEAMLASIKHRGPDYSGIETTSRAIIAQNYLKADHPDVLKPGDIPFHPHGNSRNQICYDGQIGNWAELAERYEIQDGAHREERLLVRLYEIHGSGMLDCLDDALYAFVITDGNTLFAARDPLGIKTLFMGIKDQTLYLSSELKSLTIATDQVFEFPPGFSLNDEGTLTQFYNLPNKPPPEHMISQNQMVQDVRSLIEESVRTRVDFIWPTGGLLSGGIDSSIINYLATKILQEKHGPNARLKTFALGVGKSEDVEMARLMADFLQTEHHEVIVTLEQMLEVLPEVIYNLESFDPSLVRSAVANYIISQYARKKGVQVLLSGEGGDEVFCGYLYLKKFPASELFTRQMECLTFLHNNASLRLDRMNQANGIRVVAPLISGKLLDYALAIPSKYKQKPENGQKIEKWILRKAFEFELPEQIVWRLKQEFSQGSGSANVLQTYFNKIVTDEEFLETQQRFHIVRSKEEMYYFKLFTKYFGEGRAVETVGQWIAL